MIKLIIFDAGGVLYTGSMKIVDDAVRKFLKKHGIQNFKKATKSGQKLKNSHPSEK
jgi:FMN phosphatase YigB (HAD superfamily)